MTDHNDRRPTQCCGRCPEIVGGGVDCTCRDNPRCTGPVTDDERRTARAWATEIDESRQTSIREDTHVAARVILATVPAPTPTLADELRRHAADHQHNDSHEYAAELYGLADRVEAVEKENERLSRDREAQEKALVEHGRLLSEARTERDEARAEVERLTDIIKNHPDSEFVFAPGGVIGKQAKVNLDQMTLPDPADVPAGEPWELQVKGERAIGYRVSYECRYPWSIATSFGRSDDVSDDDVTLGARLVLEQAPRVIDRPEDLDKLPVRSVVLDRHHAWEKYLDDEWYSTELNGGFSSRWLMNYNDSMTVIHTPQEEA